MFLKNKPLIVLIISLFLISCKVKQQETVSQIGTGGVNYTTKTDITEDDIRLHIGVLASDSLQGRGSATPNEALAAEYIKEKFKSLGLKSFDNKFIQQVPISTRKSFSNCELHFDGYIANYPSDFRSNILFDSLTVVSDVVFAGYGNDSDYENLSVENKWVMILENENSILYEKKSTAKSKGALGLLAVEKDDTSGNVHNLTVGNVLPSDSIPLIKISHNLSNRLLAYSGANLQEVLEKAKMGENQNFNIPTTVTATIKTESRAVTSQNVIAYIESSDYEHENEYILIGAHYDHIGTQTIGDKVLVNYGADDNASGVAGMLEIAEKLLSDKNLKYNVIFVAFGAEELGLIGSSYFCKYPPVPLENIKLMINLDMIGRMDSENRVYINTGKPNEKLNTLVDLIKESHQNLNTVMSFDSFMRGSDHTPFHNRNIPVLFFVTGLHKDYHTPGDTKELINYGGQKMLLDFVYDIVISPAMDECIRSFISSSVSP